MEKIQREDSGNAAVNAMYMARYDQKNERLRPPVDNSDQQLCRVWIRRKYIDKAWYELPAKDESKDQKNQGKSKSSDGANANYIEPTIVAIPKLGDKSSRKKKEEQPVADLFAAWSTDEAANEIPVAASLSNASNTDGNGDDWDAFGGSSATNAVTSGNAAGLVNESFQANFDNAFQANFDTATNSESDNLDPNDDFLAIASKAKTNDDSLFNTNFENAFQDALSSEKQIKQQQSQAEPIFSANFSKPSSKPQQSPANITAFAVDFDAKTAPPYTKKEGNPFAQMQQTNDSQPPLMPPSLTTTVAPLAETQKQGNPFTQHQSDITSKTHVVPNVMSQNNGIGMTSNTQIQSIGAALPNQMQVNLNSSTRQTDSDHKVGTQSELKAVEQKHANISTIDNTFAEVALDEVASGCEVSAMTQDVGKMIETKSMSSQFGTQTIASLTQNERSFAMNSVPSVSSASQQDATECLAVEDKFAGLGLDEGAVSLCERENMKEVAPIDEVAVIEQNVDMITSPRQTESKQLPTVPQNEHTICPLPNASVDSGASMSGLSLNDNLHISSVQNCGSTPLPLLQGNLVNNMQPSNLQSSKIFATVNGQQQINNTNVVFNQKAATSDNSNSNSTGVASGQQHAKNLLSPSHQAPPISASFGGPSVNSGGVANGQPQLNGTNVASNQVQAPMVHGGISQQQIQLLQLMQSMSPEQIQQMQLMMQMQALPQNAMAMQQVARNQNMQFTNNFPQNQENMPHEQMNNSSQEINTFNQGPATHQMAANQQQNHLFRQFHQNVPNQQMQFYNGQGNFENTPVHQMKTYHNFPRGGHPGQGENP